MNLDRRPGGGLVPPRALTSRAEAIPEGPKKKWRHGGRPF